MQNRLQRGHTPIPALPPFAAVLIADAPEALVELCGISLLERNLRILQRIGAARAWVLTRTVELIEAHVRAPSWARAELAVAVHATDSAHVTVEHIAKLGPHAPYVLVLNAAAYYDPRLLRALLERKRTGVLAKSSQPTALDRLLNGDGTQPDCAVIETEWLHAADPGAALFEAVRTPAGLGRAAKLDAADVPPYVVDMRRDVPVVWFPAPRPDQRILAETVLLDAAQNGTLDLPAIAHGPLETGIIRRLCRTRITPMQITLFTAAVSTGVTALFASGQLLAGAWLALIVGVLDGLDGKQARVKVETTELGKREHVLDYILELSWWIALAYHFASSGALPNAYALALLLIGSDVVDRYAKRIAKQHTGRNLDDVAPIDRFVRLIGGRRNIYIWIFAIGLAANAADKAFAFFCYWGAATAAVHMLRAFAIARQRRAV